MSHEPEEDKTEGNDDLGTQKNNVRSLSDADFAAARELYELGKGSIASLANDYKISRQALSRRLKDSGAIKASRADELVQKAQVVIERFAVKRADMIEETRLQGLMALKQARMLAQKVVIDAAKATRSFGSTDDDLKALGRYNKILVDNINASLNILNADEHIDEEDLPTLHIEDLTDQDILDHHIATGALDEDATFEDLNYESPK